MKGELNHEELFYYGKQYRWQNGQANRGKNKKRRIKEQGRL